MAGRRALHPHRAKAWRHTPDRWILKYIIIVGTTVPMGCLLLLDVVLQYRRGAFTCDESTTGQRANTFCASLCCVWLWFLIDYSKTFVKYIYLSTVPRAQSTVIATPWYVWIPHITVAKARVYQHFLNFYYFQPFTFLSLHHPRNWAQLANKIKKYVCLTVRKIFNQWVWFL